MSLPAVPMRSVPILPGYMLLVSVSTISMMAMYMPSDLLPAVPLWSVLYRLLTHPASECILCNHNIHIAVSQHLHFTVSTSLSYNTHIAVAHRRASSGT